MHILHTTVGPRTSVDVSLTRSSPTQLDHLMLETTDMHQMISVKMKVECPAMVPSWTGQSLSC